jgi:hypothetical protein
VATPKPPNNQSGNGASGNRLCGERRQTMRSFDSIFLFRRKPGTASAFILEKRQGKPFAPLETENSKGEKVCYLTKIQGKANAKRKPSWNVSIPKINAEKLGIEDGKPFWHFHSLTRGGKQRVWRLQIHWQRLSVFAG